MADDLHSYGKSRTGRELTDDVVEQGRPRQKLASMSQVCGGVPVGLGWGPPPSSRCRFGLSLSSGQRSSTKRKRKV